MKPPIHASGSSFVAHLPAAPPPSGTDRLGFARFAELNRLYPIIFVLGTTIYVWTVYAACYLVPSLGFPQHTIFEPGVTVTAEGKFTAQVQGWFFLASTLLFLHSYANAIFTEPGFIPDSRAWRMHANNDGSELAPFLIEKKKDGLLRHCKWCAKYKPDRAHHCRVLGKCVLKMDHHCPWICNTVGFYNHKYFMLILFYATCCLWILFFSLQPFIRQIITESATGMMELPAVSLFLLIFAASIGFLLGIVVTSFFAFHLYLVSINSTTIEFCEKQGQWEMQDQFELLGAVSRATEEPVCGGNADSRFDLGCFANFKAAYGENFFCWCLPFTGPEDDGIIYPHNRFQGGSLSNAATSGTSSNRTTDQPLLQMSSGISTTRRSDARKNKKDKNREKQNSAAKMKQIEEEDKAAITADQFFARTDASPSALGPVVVPPSGKNKENMKSAHLLPTAQGVAHNIAEASLAKVEITDGGKIFENGHYEGVHNLMSSVGVNKGAGAPTVLAGDGGVIDEEDTPDSSAACAPSSSRNPTSFSHRSGGLEVQEEEEELQRATSAAEQTSTSSAAPAARGRQRFTASVLATTKDEELYSTSETRSKSTAYPSSSSADGSSSSSSKEPASGR